MALAQAFQFDLMLRQKDVIGEWVPLTEPEDGEVVGNRKWLRGLRWEEIDDRRILRHITSKRQKQIIVDLTLAPMVMEELKRLDTLPAGGPVIVLEGTGRPWSSSWFRRRWREIAESVGIPRDVRNMDTRAGAITEASDAGADLEMVRHAATHSDITMTERYSRGSTAKIAVEMQKRAAYRDGQHA